MPAKDRVGLSYGSQLLQPLATQDLAFHGDSPALIVAEQDPLVSVFLPQDVIIRLPNLVVRFGVCAVGTRVDPPRNWATRRHSDAKLPRLKAEVDRVVRRCRAVPEPLFRSLLGFQRCRVKLVHFL